MKLEKIGPLLIITLFMMGAFIAHSQSPEDSTRVPTVEELYLLGKPTLMAIVEQATSADRETKLLALDDIETIIEQGEFSGEASEILYMLDYLSAEGVRRREREENRTTNYFPLVRRRAVELIGRLGKESTNQEVVERARVILLDIIRKEEEVMVKAEAAYALGTIGLDDDGLVVRTLSLTVASQTAAAPDNNFAFAVCLAIDKIAQKNQGIRNYEAYTALVTIMQGNYTRRVKDKAFEVLQNLKEYS
jgi:hypothetical protein